MAVGTGQGGSEPLVTVGLAVYNSERYVRQSLDTLLAQTYRDFVLLISDNASTDGTGDICREYAARDPRIRYHRNPKNIGMAGNYNLLFSMCRTRYFRWATSDDYWDPEMLADAVAVMEAHPDVVVCYPRAIFVDEQGREFRRWKDILHMMDLEPLPRFWRVVNHIGRVHHHLGLMRADAMRKTGLIAKHVSSDKGFVAEMALHGKFFQVEKYQIYRRMHEDSSSWATHDQAHQARRYHATGVKRIRWNGFRFYWRYAQGVGRSPLRPCDKARLYRFLLECAWEDRRSLFEEARGDLRRMFSSG